MAAVSNAIIAVNRRYSLLAPLLFALTLPLLTIASGVITALSRRPPPFDPKNKIVLITGASSGIGESIARLYAKLNATLVLVARSKDKLDELREECLALGAADAVVEICDVADADALKRLFDSVGARFSRLDCIVLNAGISMGVTLNDLDDVSVIKRIMDVNFLHCAAGAYFALPLLRKASSRGKIVVVSSVLGIIATPLRTAYSASKFALKGFFDGLRLEEPGMDVTLAYPGVVATNINASRLGGDNVKDISMHGAMSADDAARIIVEAVRTGVKDEVFTLQGKILWFVKDTFPALRDFLIMRNMRTLSKKRE